MLINFFRILLFLLELAACIAGFLAMPKLKNSFWSRLPYFLLFIVIVESIGYWLGFNSALNKYNPMLFNFVVNPAQIVFYNWLLYKNISHYNKPKANILWYNVGLYVICWIIDCAFIPNDSLWSTTFSYCIGLITILFALLLFFYHYINSDDVIYYKKDLIFWICLGLFLYYVVDLPFEGLRNTLLHVPGLFTICWYINIALSCIMYLMFIIGLLWTKPK